MRSSRVKDSKVRSTHSLFSFKKSGLDRMYFPFSTPIPPVAQSHTEKIMVTIPCFIDFVMNFVMNFENTRSVPSHFFLSQSLFTVPSESSNCIRPVFPTTFLQLLLR